MVRAMQPRFYLARSKPARIPHARFIDLAAWIDADPHETRPLPTDRPGLVLNAEHMRLFAPGCKPSPWHPGMAHKRLKLFRRHGRDPLPAIMGLEPGEAVVDATLGMGHDALLLAAAGGRVRGLEARAPILLFTLDGLRRYRPDLARRIRGVRAEHGAWLAQAPAKSVDHVFFDPMFPPAQAGINPTWSTLRAVAHPGARLPPAVLFDALRVARRTVVFKLAPYEPAPVVQGAPPVRVDGSNRLHYAIWDV